MKSLLLLSFAVIVTPVHCKPTKFGSTRVPPGPSDVGPFVLQIRHQVIDVYDVNEASQTFTVDMEFSVEWYVIIFL